MTNLFIDQGEGLEPAVKYSVDKGKIQVEGEQDWIRKVELEWLEEGHLGDLFRRHLRLLNLGL